MLMTHSPCVITVVLYALCLCLPLASFVFKREMKTNSENNAVHRLVVTPRLESAAYVALMKPRAMKNGAFGVKVV
jgi:hypothetical protein